MTRFWSLTGNPSYAEVRELQLKLVELRARDACEDTVLFLEHRPVITRGRGLQFTGEPRPKTMPLLGPIPPGMDFEESERGGDLTYHGPGQWVVYPICKLDGSGFAPARDVAGLIRRLEQLLIQLLAHYQVIAGTKPNATGVWVSPVGKLSQEKSSRGIPPSGEDTSGLSLKIASIGIAVRRCVSYHGIALNVTNDLNPFYLISPCGFAPEVMTRLKDLVPAEADLSREALESLWRSFWGGEETLQSPGERGSVSEFLARLPAGYTEDS